MIRRPPRSTRFPSTTLCRSKGTALKAGTVGTLKVAVGTTPAPTPTPTPAPTPTPTSTNVPQVVSARSEEHTSALQSRQYLVCRLLLDKHNLPPCATTYSSIS